MPVPNTREDRSELERAVVTRLIQELQPGWKSAQLWVFSVGGFRYATVETRYGLVKTVRSEPSEALWAMLAEHKRVSYDQRTGTWMSGHIMTDGDEFTCAFHNDGAPEGMPPLDHHDYRREFELYPRVLAHVPGAIKQLDGSTLLIEPIIEDFSLTDVDAATLEAEVLKVVLPVLPRKWTFAYVWFSMVGGEGHAGISVTVGKDAIQNLQPPDAMLALLTRLKKAAYDPRTGTWVSGRLEFKPGGQYRSQYSNSETPEWVPAPTVAEYRHEFEAYPRDPSAIPERIRGLLI